MNKSFKSVEEVKKHLDSVSEGPASKNTQPAGSVWHPQRKFDTTCVKPTGRTPEEEKHCRLVQKKQLEQYPASIAGELKKLKLGETIILAEEDTPQDDDIYFSASGPLGSKTSLSADGKHIGEFSEFEEAEIAALKWMKKSNFFPNAWVVSDHGNMHPHTWDKKLMQKYGPR